MSDDSWDFYLSQINLCEGIDELEKQELLRDWGYLIAFLGKDWFKTEENKFHPLRGYFGNVGLSGLRWIGELGLAIESLKEKENFDGIRERLLLIDAFEEAYYELRVGYSLLNLGVSFEFLKPSKIKKKKTSDIIVNMGDRKIFLEITKKNNPEDILNSSENFQKISWFLLSKGGQTYNDFGFYYDILKPLSTPRTEQILKICEDLLDKAKKSGFEEYHRPNTIDLYIFKRENVDKVPKEKQVMRGMSPIFDELSRIRGTIRDKEVQLRTETPNVLLIFDSLLWPLEKDLFYSKLVDTLEETVNQFTNLSAVVIYIETFYLLEKEESYINEGQNYIAIKGYDKKLFRSKNKVIILNEFAKYHLLSHEIEILKSI
ncbi:MAG: hypothetical protein O8C63_05925 [Candidatus Methanoperedens sp.]|nr:hypothetical protein [Candidatus Methanoperedens sp.]